MNAATLIELIADSLPLRQVEPDVFSVLETDLVGNAYDTEFGNIYDFVACSPVYNRLVWGYSIRHFAKLEEEALAGSGNGIVLDLGCGSLAFTAGTYGRHPGRRVVFVDQSLKMLRLAKSRMVAMHGSIPAGMVFLHADAVNLPFRSHAFGAVVCMNLLHCVPDIGSVFSGARRVLAGGGRMYFTTLVRAGRFADRYLEALARAGKLVGRDAEDLRAAVASLGEPWDLRLLGNLASLKIG